MLWNFKNIFIFSVTDLEEKDRMEASIRNFEEKDHVDGSFPADDTTKHKVIKTNNNCVIYSPLFS